MMTDEERANALNLLGGGLTPAERSRRAILGEQESKSTFILYSGITHTIPFLWPVMIPLYTLLGIHL